MANALANNTASYAQKIAFWYFGRLWLHRDEANIRRLLSCACRNETLKNQIRNRSGGFTLLYDGPTPTTFTTACDGPVAWKRYHEWWKYIERGKKYCESAPTTPPDICRQHPLYPAIALSVLASCVCALVLFGPWLLDQWESYHPSENE
ncbi:hypothetical protein SMMN14_08053 [Sphaerulina musiva]